MKPRKAFALLSIVGLALICFGSLAHAAGQTITRFTLFAGGNIDTLEQASRWIPIQGARKVIIRTWTSRAAFALASADTIYGDSLAGFKVLLSDSVAFIGRDSSGTLVTARSTQTNTNSFPICADSLVLPVTLAGDSVVSCYPLPVNKQLRAPSNGTGYVSVIYPIQGGLGVASEGGIIGKQYLRIRCTSQRRHTAGTSTAIGGGADPGNRIVGLKGFKMTADVYKEN